MRSSFEDRNSISHLINIANFSQLFFAPIFPLLPSCKIQKSAIMLTKCQNIRPSPTGSQKSLSSLWSGLFSYHSPWCRSTMRRDSFSSHFIYPTGQWRYSSRTTMSWSRMSACSDWSKKTGAEIPSCQNEPKISSISSSYLYIQSHTMSSKRTSSHSRIPSIHTKKI